MGQETWSNKKWLDEQLQRGIELPTATPAPTQYEVTLLPSDILTMAETPIEILPAPGAGKYYDIHKIVLEYNYDSGFSYIMTSDYITFRFGNVYTFAYVDGAIISATQDRAAVVRASSITDAGMTPITYSKYIPLNTNFIISTYNETNITDNSQTGTLRVVVDYEIKTLGA